MSRNENNKVISFAENTTCNNFNIGVSDLCKFTSFFNFSYIVTFTVAEIVYSLYVNNVIFPFKRSCNCQNKKNLLSTRICSTFESEYFSVLHK